MSGVSTFQSAPIEKGELATRIRLSSDRGVLAVASFGASWYGRLLDEASMPLADAAGVPGGVMAWARTYRRLRAKMSPVVGSSWTQESRTAVPAAFLAAFELSDLEREYLLRSVIASQALEDVHVSHEVASRLLDEVLREPLPDIR